MKTSATAAQDSDAEWGTVAAGPARRRGGGAGWATAPIGGIGSMTEPAGTCGCTVRGAGFLRDGISGASEPRGGGRSRPGRARRPFAVARPTGSMTERIWQPPQNTARPGPCTHGGGRLWCRFAPARFTVRFPRCEGPGWRVARARCRAVERCEGHQRHRRAGAVVPDCRAIRATNATPTRGCYSFIGPAVVPEARR